MSDPVPAGGPHSPRPPLPLWLLPLLVLPACASAPFQRRPSSELLELGAAGVLREAAARAGRIEAMRATGTLQVRVDGGSLSGNIVLRYAEPDSFRFDITAYLGVTVTQAVLVGERVQIWTPAERTVREGRIDPDLMLSLNGFPLHPSMVREWVLGPALGRDWARLYDGIDRFDVSSGRVVIGLRMPDGHRLLVILGDDLLFQSAAFLDPFEQILWQTRYTAWRRRRGVLLPDRIEVSYPAAGLEVTFDVIRRDLDPPGGAGDFVLSIPPDAIRRPILPGIAPEGAGP